MSESVSSVKLRLQLYCHSRERKGHWLESRDDVEEHLEIAHKGVGWVDERGRAILLVSEVASPGKPVPDQEHAEALCGVVSLTKATE